MQFGICASEFREESLFLGLDGVRDLEVSLEGEDVFSSGLDCQVVYLAHQEGENRIDDSLLVGITSHKKWKRSEMQKE